MYKYLIILLFLTGCQHTDNTADYKLSPLGIKVYYHTQVSITPEDVDQALRWQVDCWGGYKDPQGLKVYFEDDGKQIAYKAASDYAQDELWVYVNNDRVANYRNLHTELVRWIISFENGTYNEYDFEQIARGCI